MPLALEADALVVLVGASASGKSWWAHGHFRDTQVVSSDRCRALVSDDQEDQGVNREAFAVFYEIIRQRLALGRLTVADSTGLQEFARRRLLHLARSFGRPAHLLVFQVPLEALLRQNAGRSRRVPEEIVRRHEEQLRALLESGALAAEGFQAVHRLVFPFGPETAPVIVRTTPPDPAPAA